MLQNVGRKDKLAEKVGRRRFTLLYLPPLNRLPIEPPLITVDLSNQIMNHTAPQTIPYRVSIVHYF